VEIVVATASEVEVGTEADEDGAGALPPQPAKAIDIMRMDRAERKRSFFMNDFPLMI
jgi:hypothetical protein